MKERNWTDEELAKALLKSIEYGEYITYFDDLGNCKKIKVMDIVDLINRLKCNTKLDSWKNKFLNALKEKEELQKDYIELDLEARELRTKIDELTEERENMQAVIFALEEEKLALKRENANVISMNDTLYREKRQAVKDTAKEIWDDCVDKIMRGCGDDKEFWVMEILIETFKKYGVGFEVE